MSTSTTEVIVVENPGVLAQRAARHFARVARAAIERSGRATVALSGGSTPRALFSLLANPPHRGTVEWPKLHVFWADERTVPPDHEESNYRLAYDELLRHVPVPAHQIHRMRGEIEPAVAADDYERALRAVFGEGEPPVFDLIQLGVGDDGHTASLFPGTGVLEERERFCSVNQVVKLGTTRITLTVPVLTNAANILVLVAGADKAEAVARAIEGPENLEETPAQIPRQARGHVTWLLDAAAAGRLSPAARGGA